MSRLQARGSVRGERSHSSVLVRARRYTRSDFCIRSKNTSGSPGCRTRPGRRAGQCRFPNSWTAPPQVGISSGKCGVDVLRKTGRLDALAVAAPQLVSRPGRIRAAETRGLTCVPYVTASSKRNRTSRTSSPATPNAVESRTPGRSDSRWAHSLVVVFVFDIAPKGKGRRNTERDRQKKIGGVVGRQRYSLLMVREPIPSQSFQVAVSSSRQSTPPFSGSR